MRLPRLVGQGRALDLILTGRKVCADEALRIGACERVVPDGQSRLAAEALAPEIARFPQAGMRADCAPVHAQEGLSAFEVRRAAWRISAPLVAVQGIAGAARFRAGRRRHVDFEDI